MASKTRYIRATAVGTISPGEGGEKREEGEEVQTQLELSGRGNLYLLVCLV